MEIDDRITVATPEGVDVDLVVAGLGSRFTSSLVDTTLQVAAIVPFLLAGGLIGGLAGPAVALLAILLVAIGVPTAFDAFAAGRTPGRRLSGLQLVTEEGATVPFVPAATRNIIRIVDFLPFFYCVGVLAILATPRNQRLGDLAAGTLVVRVAKGRRSQAVVVPGAARRAPAEGRVPASSAGWDLTGLTASDEAVVRSFLARRGELEPVARTRVAAELARRLEPVVVGPDREAGDEAFLEQVVAGREARGR